MAAVALPRYGHVPFDPSHRTGVVEAFRVAVRNGGFLPPTTEATTYYQRDVNEMIDRGWLKKHERRRVDAMWNYMLTLDGVAKSMELL